MAKIKLRALLPHLYPCTTDFNRHFFLHKNCANTGVIHKPDIENAPPERRMGTFSRSPIFIFPYSAIRSTT